MKERVREWLAETHGARFELVRHFLPRFFDSDLVGSPGDWLRVAGGAAALLASSWMLLGALLIFKYDQVPPGLRAIEARNDLISITAMCVCVTVLLAALLWQSLFPSSRDFLALAGMPVKSADMFFGKFCALLGVYAMFSVLLVLPTALVCSGITHVPLMEAILTMAAASTVAFFGLASLQGIFLNLLPGPWFERFMIWAQAVMAALAIGGFSAAAWKGPLLLGMLGLPAYKLLLAMVAVPCFAALTYLLSFHRYQKLVLEAPVLRARRRMDWLARVVEFVFRNPQEQAAFSFLRLTIQRNRVHRLAVLVYAGLATAYVARAAINLLAGSAKRSDWDRVMYTAWPLALTLFTLLGLRHLFSLPADLKSNWMFRVADREGRKAWLDAMERFVLLTAALPLFIGALLAVHVDGPFVSLGWVLLALATEAICFEALFRRWRKMPFTCAYIPGKRSPLLNGILFFMALMLLTPVTWIIHGCASNPASFLVLFTLELLALLQLRTARMKNWGLVALQYEDSFQSDVDAFGLAEDGGNFAQEQYHRQWSEYLRTGGAETPLFRPLDPGETYLGRVRDWIRAIPQDLQFALRMFTKSPGFAVTVILTLGLGLGLNAAFFTVFNAFLLEPLAVRDPARLVSIEFTARNRTPVHLRWEDYQRFAADVAPGAEVAASTLEGTGLDGRAAKIAMVGANYFSLLGVTPAAGRLFQQGETGLVMVLAHRVWQRRFGGDPGIIGRKLPVDGTPFEVIGVAKPEFPGVNVGTIAVAPPQLARYGVSAADFWVPAEVSRKLSIAGDLPVLGIVARLKPGVTAERMRSEMTVLARALTGDHPAYEQVMYTKLESLDIPITWTALEYSLPLLAAFALTMLIPCANAANMMLARAMVRQRELGVRLSLGARRGRLVRQLLTESLVLSLLASGLGVVLAWAALDVFVRVLYATAPPTLLFRARIPDFPFGGHVFFYMLVISGLTTALFALAPASQATRAAVAYALRGEFTSLLRSSRLRDALVVGQVASCVMLLVVAGVLLRGTSKAKNMARGYDVAGIYGVANVSPEDRRQLALTLREEPWVESTGYFGRPFQEMDSIEAGGSRERVYLHFSSGSFFDMVRLPIVRGRTFTDTEAESQAPVAIVSELAARQLWPNGENPLGKTFAISRGSNESVRMPRFERALVIGVSADIVARVRDGGPRPMIHYPDSVRRDTLLVIRGKGGREQTQRLLEEAVGRSPGAAHGARVVDAQEIQVWETYPQQAVTWLSGLLGGVALVLTISGMYGVMAYLVSQRTKEIGIRMALGATSAQVAKFVLTDSARLGAIGLAFGTVLAVGGLQWGMSQVELSVNLFDGPAYVVTFAVVAGAGLLAVLGPAHRACRVDPQAALRRD